MAFNMNDKVRAVLILSANVKLVAAHCPNLQNCLNFIQRSTITVFTYFSKILDCNYGRGEFIHYTSTGSCYLPLFSVILWVSKHLKWSQENHFVWSTVNDLHLWWCSFLEKRTTNHLKCFRYTERNVLISTWVKGYF